ncbi:DUF7196 family protein [Streptosporangium sp. CA-115845]|uniref:DUF7196 family protein n=1 Tax=Streptosporangium sp. CA-115845 TaxID=3240071 RepID=UPI003D8FEB93
MTSLAPAQRRWLPGRRHPIGGTVMGCGCNKKNQQVSRYVVVYNDGSESAPYTTAREADAEKRRAGATSPVKTVTAAARPAVAAAAPAVESVVVKGAGEA